MLAFVDERVQAAGVARGVGQILPVPGVRDAARDGGHPRNLGELGAGGFEVLFAAGVDDERPAVLGQPTGQREAEASGGAGDEGGASGLLVIRCASRSCLDPT
jgi:hypothetical protein